MEEFISFLEQQKIPLDIELLQAIEQNTLPLIAIALTIQQSGAYLSTRTSLNFPQVKSPFPLNPIQESALETVLSNSPIALISGIPGTGKTRIARAGVHLAIEEEHRVLILANHQQTLTQYRDLPILPIYLSQPYKQQLKRWLQEKWQGANLKALPLHLLPDRLIENLPIYSDILEHTPEQLHNYLRTHFPKISPARLDLLSYRVRTLTPLLEKQAQLQQSYKLLSDTAIEQLITQMEESAAIPILGTFAEFTTRYRDELQGKIFDIIFVEEAHLLTWKQVIQLACSCHKLVLFGDAIAPDNTIPFSYLERHLSPAYRLTLTEQFRLSPSLARSILPLLANRYIHTSFRRQVNSPLTDPLLWQDIRSGEENERIWRFVQTEIPINWRDRIGIITFSDTTKQQLQSSCPEELKNLIYIGTINEWVGE
ncbi:MAG: hypothetical protein WBB28_13980, partial [Crinalium sp.]